MPHKSNPFFLFSNFRFKFNQKRKELLLTSLRKPSAIIAVYIGIFLRIIKFKSTGFKLILKGRRIHHVSVADNMIKKTIKKMDKADFLSILPKKLPYPIEQANGRHLILKLPIISNNVLMEKGVIIIKFTETFNVFYSSLNINLLTKYFRLILEPSWSGYSIEEILSWTTLGDEKILVLSPDDDDFHFLTQLDSNLIPIKIGAADWVNPEIFYKIENTEKKFDAIYVANFNPIKRVDRFIRAAVNIYKTNKNYRVALVCAGIGSVRKEILTLLESAKNKSNITLFDGMPQAELNKLLNESKVNVLLSLKEGANKGLSEGIFSGTPAILLNENIGVKRENINDNTGKIVPDSALEDTLIWFSKNYKKYDSSKWGNEHMSPDASTNTIEKTLEKIELEDGFTWTEGIFTKTNQPELQYLNSENTWLLDIRPKLISNFILNADEKNTLQFLIKIQNQENI